MRGQCARRAMKRLGQATLRQKLTWLTMVCSVVALSTTAVALAAYEFVFYRRAVLFQLETIGAMTARNSTAALALSNLADAARVLASLETEPAITCAALYDGTGKQLAEYRRVRSRAGANRRAPPTAPRDGVVRAGRTLDIVMPVGDETRFGTLLMRADLSAIGERLVAYAWLLLGTTLLSGLLAFLLSDWLSKRIVAPVQALARAASGIKTNADYSVRVARTTDAELGTLTDAFNEMLARVEANERALYRGNERLRLALQAAQIGTWDWNLLRDEVTWSERTYEIFNVAPGTTVDSEAFFAVAHPDERGRVRAAVEEAARTLRDFSIEFQLATTEAPPAPHYVAVLGMFLKTSAGDPLRAVGVTMDVTERRRAESRIIESERRFRAMAERAPALIWSCDETLSRDYCNKTWLAFTGRPWERELGQGWQEGVPELDLKRWQETVGAAAAQLDPYSIEYRLRRSDGALRWVIETGSPRFSADGAFAGYLGTCIDITARKENEAELESHVRLRTRELELANQELETFSYSVSHDLRGPVRAIKGFTEIALEDCEAGNPGVAVERLQRVLKAAERMNRLIDAFLGMARISRAEMRIGPVDLTRIAEEMVGFLRSTSGGRTVDVAVEPALVCRGDERLLRIVMENLLSNAWKFTSRTKHPRIEVGAREEGSERVFFVRDNGAGFNAALSHKLFRAFERLHHDAQFEGLGVGLSTVHRVIEKHQGRIWAESTEGSGATFNFTVPEPKPRPVQAAAPRQAAAVEG